MILEIDDVILLVQTRVEEEKADVVKVEAKNDLGPQAKLLPELAHLGIRPDSFEEKHRIGMDMFQRFFNPRAVLALSGSGMEEGKVERPELLQGLGQSFLVITRKDFGRRMGIFSHAPRCFPGRFGICFERDALDIGSIRGKIKRSDTGRRTDLQDPFRLEIIDNPEKQLPMRTFDFTTYAYASFMHQLPSY